MKANPEMERLIFPVEFKLLAGDQGIVEGYASIFSKQDENREVVDPGAFKKTIAERVMKGKVPYQDGHIWDTAHTLGTVIWAEEDANGLRYRAKLSNAPSVMDARQKMLEGHATRNSVGYVTMRDRFERDPATNKMIRHLVELKLLEISLMPVPAMSDAINTSIKAVVPFQDLPLAPRSRAWDAHGAVARMLEWAGGQADATKTNWTKYRRGFLWWNTDDPEMVGAYKLPIADVINGNLTAIPRALFAAAAAVQGARGGVEIPSDDMPGVRAHLERYYERMAHEFNDETIVAPWSRKSIDAMVLDSLSSGGYEFQSIRNAAGELLGIMNAEDRKRLIEELSAEPAARPLTEGKSDGGLARLKRRGRLFNSELVK